MKLLALAAVVLLSYFSAATAGDKPDPSTATTWLDAIDHERYSDSWNAGSKYFQTMMTEAQWKRVLQTSRTPIGPVVRRHHMLTQYVDRLPGIPKGTYAIIQFDSSFRNKKETVETVVLTQEPDGQWRPIGYSMR